MASRNGGAFHPRVKSRLQRLVAAYLSPCRPSSISPPRPRQTRPQAAQFARRSRQFRHCPQTIPMSSVDPTPPLSAPLVPLLDAQLPDTGSWLFCPQNHASICDHRRPPRASTPASHSGRSQTRRRPRPRQHVRLSVLYVVVRKTPPLAFMFCLMRAASLAAGNGATAPEQLRWDTHGRSLPASQPFHLKRTVRIRSVSESVRS